jgi:hypothetical protein
MPRKREQKISWTATQGQKTLSKYEQVWSCLCRKCKVGLRIAEAIVLDNDEAIVLDNDEDGLYSKDPTRRVDHHKCYCVLGRFEAMARST